MGAPSRSQGSQLLESTYYRVPINLYQSGDIIEEDLYFLYQGNYLLYRLKNLVWKDEDRKKLEEFAVEHLYIRCPSERDHNRFLEKKLKRILEQPLISSKEKAEIVYETSRSLLEELFEKPESPDVLRRSLTATMHSIEFLEKDKQNFFDLMSMARSNFSEFSHGLHTAAYSISLAKQIGIKAYNQISAIGIAALLHDIGKTKINRKILEKADQLTDDEKIEIEKHPAYSYEIIHRTGSVPSLAEKIILQHHEKPNGSGYPSGLKSDMHAFSRIVSLCDCFDLLTSQRSYKNALKPIDAIEWLKTEGSSDYDQELVIQFIKMLKR